MTVKNKTRFTKVNAAFPCIIRGFNQGFDAMQTLTEKNSITEALGFVAAFAALNELVTHVAFGQNAPGNNQPVRVTAVDSKGNHYIEYGLTVAGCARALVETIRAKHGLPSFADEMEKERVAAVNVPGQVTTDGTCGVCGSLVGMRITQKVDGVAIWRPDGQGGIVSSDEDAQPVGKPLGTCLECGAMHRIEENA